MFLPLSFRGKLDDCFHSLRSQVAAVLMIINGEATLTQTLPPSC